MKSMVKKHHYNKAVNLAYMLDDYILEIAEMNGYDSTSKEGKKLAKAYNKLQDLQSLLWDAQEKAGYGDE